MSHSLGSMIGNGGSTKAGLPTAVMTPVLVSVSCPQSTHLA